MKAGIFGLSCALGITILFALTGAAAAEITAVYGCRFYADGKPYAEFRINEIDHTDWSDEAILDPSNEDPRRIKVDVKGEPGERHPLHFKLDDEGIEIRVSDELTYQNAEYIEPSDKSIAGECEQADSERALHRWFSERERQHRRLNR